MKYVVCVPDGCADEPCEPLGGQTPLEVAATPVLDSLAARGVVGRAAVIPAGMAPGSDVGNMSILGYDPERFHTGRAPIEAAALGIALRPDQVAYRCNLVTLGGAGGASRGAETMVDFAGGHPDTSDAVRVIAALDEELGRGATGSAAQGLEFHPGVQYRHVMVAPAEWADAECTPPHDISDRPAVWPTGSAGPLLRGVMDASRAIVGASGLAANQVWLWGQGFQPTMTPFREQFGVEAGMVTAVDLVRGLGHLTDMRVVEVEGATGWYDTNYEGKRDAALAALGSGECELFVVHVEATDEAGHAGDAAEKVRALENWDSRILAGLVDGLDAIGPWRMLLLPDHATPLRLKTHTDVPVPYLLVDSREGGSGGVYTEAGVAEQPVVAGHELMGRLLSA